MLPRREVVWVNTIGTRPPRLDLATMRRGWEKARQWFRPARPAVESDAVGPRLLNPRMWPWISSTFDRRINRRLLRRQILPVLRELSEPPIAVTTVPIVADLVGALPVAKWVYYCVDDFGQWPGLDGPALRRSEERLVRAADGIIAVSEPLRERLNGFVDRPIHLLTHGVDLDFWKSDATDSMTELRGLEPPFVVFWGVVDRRMDVNFVRRLANDLPRGTIVLAGPHDQPDLELLKLPRVACLGRLQLGRLPRLAEAAAVLVMPYVDRPVTRAMQPLKLKEYLATGKPVVARDLPANREWAGALDLADSAERFSAAVFERLESGLPGEQRSARKRLAQETWHAKAAAFEVWIDECAPVKAPESAVAV
jgi:glycosyltransferase involved in cell wall biosynthesis